MKYMVILLKEKVYINYAKGGNGDKNMNIKTNM